MTHLLRRPFVWMIAVMVLCAGIPTLMSACSPTKQFATTGGPIVQDIAEDIAQYVKPTTENEIFMEQVQAFSTAVATGDKTTAVTLWYGDGMSGVRAGYVKWLNSDPLFSKPGGEVVRGVKMHNVTTLDYVFSLGTPKK